jgi:hypothetical protein
MTNKTIPAEEVFREWRKDPEFMREYAALEEEFALASARIEIRNRNTNRDPDTAAAHDESRERHPE